MPTYVEEQKELKDSFKNALQDDDDDDDGLLMLKQKTDHEKQKVFLNCFNIIYIM